jgi:hypothetical protein
MTPNDEMEAQWTGHDLFDLDGDKIGKVEGVRYGDVKGNLTWLVVETGILGTKKILVPAGEVRRAGDRLSVGYTKDRVKDAPKVENESALTEADQGELCRYYGLQYIPSASEPSEGCVEMKDIRPAG